MKSFESGRISLKQAGPRLSQPQHARPVGACEIASRASVIAHAAAETAAVRWPFVGALCRLSRMALLLGLWLAGINVGRGATFVVENPNDQGPGSLRQAVVDSNAQGGSNTIVFSRTGPTWILLWAGEILVTNNVNIVGSGGELVVWAPNKTAAFFTP